jgi:hypothetical protein
MTIQPDTETLLAVVLGALLATAGGFSERQFERMVQKREKEHSAALLFGELLSAMRVMMRLADQARGRGDPYGAVTLRFFRAVKREVEIYDRNRETLLDLRDPRSRAAISVLIARLSFSLDGVLDSSTEIVALEREREAMTADNDQRAKLEQSLAALSETRKAAFDFAVETAEEITPLLATLAPIARHNFGATQSALPTDIFAQPNDAPA